MTRQASDATSSATRSRPEHSAQHAPLKRLRVSSPVEASASPPLLYKLPPLHTLTAARTVAVQGGSDCAHDKLGRLRAMYQADVALVYRELKTALDVCRRPQTLPGAAVPPEYLHKLEKSVETLQKLFRLLSARSAPRLRGPAHLSLLCAVETQIQTQVLPVAMVIRSFKQTSALLEPKAAPASSHGPQDAADCESTLLSPRSPSAVLPVSSSSSSCSLSSSSSVSSSGSASATDKSSDSSTSWRYLSMVLSLQL